MILYSINITLQDGTIIFNGLFKVDNTNLVIEFYETINGTTDYTNNLLLPTQTGVYGNNTITIKGGYNTIFYSNYITSYNPLSNQTIKVNYGYDNMFNQSWKQFDFYGIILSQISYFKNTSTINYSSINLFANNIGDETTINIGRLTIYSSIYSDPTNKQHNNVDIIYNIQLISISNECFPYNTPITTDQGNIPIEKIDPIIHTINNKPIKFITKTITTDTFLVSFEKNAVDINYPSNDTIISKHHKIFYKGKMIEAFKFIGHFQNVKKIDYNGEILYNVLMKQYGTMIVNNLICETLHPNNIIAKIYRSSLTQDHKNILITTLNNYNIKQDCSTPIKNNIKNNKEGYDVFVKSILSFFKNRNIRMIY